MSLGNHHSIENYLSRITSGLHPNRSGLLSKKGDSSKNSVFTQILSSYPIQPHKNINTQSVVLKASDYLANPLPPKYFNKLYCRQTALEMKIGSSRGSSLNLRVASSQNHSTEINPSVEQKTKTFQSEQNTPFEISQRPTGLPEHKMIQNSVNQAAAKYNLPSELIKAVIKAESNFDVKAVSSAGAQGLMQLMPATAEELGVKNPFDIEQNIDGGSRYLKQMLDRFDGNVKLALAAYNAGPGAVEKYGGNIPPFAETKHFVNRVLRFSEQIV